MNALPFVFIAIAALTAPSLADERPNIVVLLADDLGWRDLACTGHKHHRTPHLDRLAREGISFTGAHSAAPICSASRAALLTGKSAARLNYEFVPKFEAGRQQGPWPMITPDYPTELPPATPTVASLLKAAGYSTAFAGKWHLNRHQGHYLGWRTGHGPESFGFDQAFDDFGAHPYGYGKEKPAPIKGDAFPEDSLTGKAVDFIRNDHDRPFLLWLSFYHVHDPFHSPCVDRVAWHQSQLPENASPKRAHYAAMVETLDHEVGRILDALDAAGHTKNTLIVFTSDNGGHPEVSTNGPLRGSKWNLYQGGLRVPLLARWPGRSPAGSTCADTLTGSDLPATLLDAAGLPTTSATDGTSVLPRLKGESDSPTGRDRILTWHFPFYQPETRYAETRRGTGVEDFAISQTQPTAAIRSGNWKLIHHFEDGRDELFDLAADPSESNDRSDSEKPRTLELRRTLFEQLTASKARLPRPKP
jgi:uncharacterized sulfatase